MPSISIRRSHNLTRAQALAAVREIAAQLAADHGISTVWSGDSAQISGPGLQGELHLRPHRIELEVQLGFMLMMFRDKLVARIESRLDELLAVRPPPNKTNRAPSKRGNR
jgi:putative polyhydroxyalkanoate system protein